MTSDLRISPMDDIWHYPLDRWAVWNRGERLGERGEVARGFRKLADAKAWASERFGVTGWARDEHGDYVPRTDTEPPATPPAASGSPVVSGEET